VEFIGSRRVFPALAIVEGGRREGGRGSGRRRRRRRGF